MGLRWRQHPGAVWFAVVLGAAIVVVAVAGRSEIFGKAKTPPRPTNASLRLGPGHAPTRPNHVIRAGASATAIAVGDYSTCAVVADRVDCWGDDAHGEFGGGAHASSLTPVSAAGIRSAQSLGLGGSQACAVVSGGRVICWGAAAAAADRHAPTFVTTAGRAVSVAVGVAHACALIAGGSVECWGAGANGQLGNGENRASPSPVHVEGLSGVQAIAAGLAHTCALLGDGTVDCWGSNANGQLGDGKALDSAVPVQVAGLSGPAVGIAAGDSHSCALMRDGSVECWGWNIEGQLGNGAGDSATPVQVAGIRTATAISAGGNDTCALLRRGEVECWGANLSGQLGNGTTADSSTPVAVAGLSNGVTAISTGLGHSCALISGGATTCWGSNTQGQLGNGTRTFSSVPVAVTGLGLAPDGSGTVTASTTVLSHGAKHVTMSFAYTAAPGGIHDGSVTIRVPKGWDVPSALAGAPGFATASAGRLTVSGRTIRVAGLTMAGGDTLAIGYGARSGGGPGATPPDTGGAIWPAHEQSSLSGALSPLGKSPVISVLAPDGSGTLTASLLRVRSAGKAAVDFTYIPEGGLRNGTLVVGVPAGWSAPTTSSGRPGFVSASHGSVAVKGRTIVIAGLTLGPRTPLKVEYRAAVAPSDNVGRQTWQAQEQSGQRGRLTDLAAPVIINVLSADGSGRASVNTAAVGNGATNVTLVFAYIADAGGLSNGEVTLTVPPGWSPPSAQRSAPGYVVTSFGTPRIQGRTIVVPVASLSGGDSFSITYGAGRRARGAEAPKLGGGTAWTMSERSSAQGHPRKLLSSPQIQILAPDGSGTIALASPAPSPGSRSTVVFVFTAAPGGMSGGSLELTAPAGWSPPSSAGSDPGYISAAPGNVSVHGRTVTVSGLSLYGGQPAVIVYGSRSAGGPGAVSPNTGAGSRWDVRERSSRTGRFIRIPSP